MFYFDESGDTGNLNSGSNTDYFSLGIYKEVSEKYTQDLVLEIRSQLKISNNASELKWHYLNKQQRKNFEQIYEKHKQNFFVIGSSKKEISGDALYQNLLIELISKHDLYGEYIYVGDQLSKLTDRVRKYFKDRFRKVKFKNTKRGDVLGVQIADLISGFHREQLQNYKK